MKNSTRITKFTPSQEVALRDIERFRNTPIDHKNINSRVLVLIGPAGSGKTTLIKYAFEDLIECDEDLDIDDEKMFRPSLFKSLPNVVGVCVAHKAKRNLKKSIPFVKTFASYFNMDSDVTIDGNREFVVNPSKLSTSMAKKYIRVVVHDEVSMYDHAMIQLVLKETHPNTKIILMGDDAQLPPINSEGDEDSPAFKLKNIVKLKERVRQTEGNPILELSDIIREEIYGNKDIGRILSAMKEHSLDDGKGFTSLRYRDFLNDYKNSTDNYIESKVIAYRNEAINNFNGHIRNYLHPNTHALYSKGEIIYMNDTYFNELKEEISPIDHLEEIMMLDENKEYRCYNSDEYTILNVEIAMLENIKVYKVWVKDENDRLVYIPFVHPEGEAEWKKRYYGLTNLANKAIDYEKRKYFFKLRWGFVRKFGNGAYAYALTAYKAQGSGYKNIYVDVNDIVTLDKISAKRKLQTLYTAITRAEHKVTFLKQ